MLIRFPLEYFPDGVPTAGATPKWLDWRQFDTQKPMTPPQVDDYGHGVYAFLWDAERDGDAYGVIDWGDTAPAGYRYATAYAFRDMGRLLTTFPNGPGFTAVVVA